MGKLFAAGFLLAFSACPLWAQEYATLSQGPGGPELAIGWISGSAASMNAAVQFNGAVGAEGFLGLVLSKDLSIGVVTGYDRYTYLNNPNPFIQGLEAAGLPPSEVGLFTINTSGNLHYVPILLELKGYLYRGGFRPYGLLGVGAAYNSATNINTLSYNGQTLTATGNVSETDLLVAPGLGVMYQLEENLDIFLQFRVDIDFTSNKNTDIGTFTFSSNGTTTTATAPTDLTGDSPTFFIPFEAGVDFNL